MLKKTIKLNFNKLKAVFSTLIIFVLLFMCVLFLNYNDFKKEMPEVYKVIAEKESNSDKSIIYEKSKILYSKAEKERFAENKKHKNKIHIVEYPNSKKFIKYKIPFVIEVKDNGNWDFIILQLKIVLELVIVFMTALLMPLIVNMLNLLRNHFINGVHVLTKKQVFDITLVSVVGTYIIVKLLNVYWLSFNFTLMYVTVVGAMYVLLTLNEEYVLNKKENKKIEEEKEEVRKRREKRLALKEEKRVEKEIEIEIEIEIGKEAEDLKDVKNNEKNIEGIEKVSGKDNEEIIDLGDSYRSYLLENEEKKNVDDFEAINNHLDKIKVEKEIKDFYEKVKEGKIILVEGEYVEKSLTDEDGDTDEKKV